MEGGPRNPGGRQTGGPSPLPGHSGCDGCQDGSDFSNGATLSETLGYSKHLENGRFQLIFLFLFLKWSLRIVDLGLTLNLLVLSP